MKSIKALFEPADLFKIFDPDFEKGKLVWEPKQGNSPNNKTWNKRFSGKPAGRKIQRGVTQIVITHGKTRYYSNLHTLLWAMFYDAWPPTGMVVDHKDCDPMNNEISNLRIATNGQNSANAKLRCDNSSGFKGVSWFSKRQKFVAQISINGKNSVIGCFNNPTEAAEAYDNAAREAFGEFARTNFKGVAE